MTDNEKTVSVTSKCPGDVGFAPIKQLRATFGNAD